MQILKNFLILQSEVLTGFGNNIIRIIIAGPGQ